MKKRAIIIGSGVGGLATSCLLGHAGYEVTVFEKNSNPGGKAGSFDAAGFRFDKSPAWYIMPDIFRHYFKLIGEDAEKILPMSRLEVAYRVFFKDLLFGAVEIRGRADKDGDTLESLEPGARNKLIAYLENASYGYEKARKDFLYRNFDSRNDIYKPDVLLSTIRMRALTNMQRFVASYFTGSEVQKLIQAPLMFMGANPQKVPAFYSILSHSDFRNGIYYPDGGVFKIVETLIEQAEKRGVRIASNNEVASIIVEGGKVAGIKLENGEKVEADLVISNAAMPHTELALLEPQHRTYGQEYWQKRKMGPGALIMYLGVGKTYPDLQHHNFVINKDWDTYFKAVFNSKKWPADPTFYVANINKTDPDSAPEGHENLMVMVPLPAMTEYSEEELEIYSERILHTMEKTMHLDGLNENIVYKKLIGPQDFKDQYNSFRGSAFGLAHSFFQTGAFRPHNFSRKVNGLFYVGADTNPGVGISLSLVSAELVYKRLIGEKGSGKISTI